MPEVITDADEISRCIIFNRAFKDDIHVDGYLWRFDNSDDDGISHESAVLRRLAPDPPHVHNIGCEIAAEQNERRQTPPGPKRRYYCGFRTASYASLPKSGENYEVTFTVDGEGHDAHVDVALKILVDGKSARAVCRTNAGLELAEQFGLPAPHRCECDAGDDHHPFGRWGDDCLTDGLKDRWADLVVTDSPDAITHSSDAEPELDLNG